MIKSIGIISGKFKPPHAGHFQAIQNINNENDQVHVFISPIEQNGINANTAKSILLEYFKLLSNSNSIHLHISEESPVKSAMSYIAKLGDSKNAKDFIVNVYALTDDMQRFEALNNFKGNLRKINKIETGRINGISSTQLRNAIENNDIDKFKEGIPSGIDYKKVWKLLKENGAYTIPADSFKTPKKYDFNVQPSKISTNLGGIPNHWTNSNPISRWDFMTNPVINNIRENNSIVLTFNQFCNEQINNKK